MSAQALIGGMAFLIPAGTHPCLWQRVKDICMLERVRGDSMGGLLYYL